MSPIRCFPRGSSERRPGARLTDPSIDAYTNARFRLRASDFFAVLAGRENADLLSTAGRIEVEGDLSIALKMRKLFRAQR